jgi:hypothetical protein
VAHLKWTNDLFRNSKYSRWKLIWLKECQKQRSANNAIYRLNKKLYSMQLGWRFSAKKNNVFCIAIGRFDNRSFVNDRTSNTEKWNSSSNRWTFFLLFLNIFCTERFYFLIFFIHTNRTLLMLFYFLFSQMRVFNITERTTASCFSDVMMPLGFYRTL